MSPPAWIGVPANATAGLSSRAGPPWLLCRRRAVGGPSTAAYFDLITDEGRLFFGGSFHFGLNISRQQVRQGRELIAEVGIASRVDIRHGDVLQMGCRMAGLTRRSAWRPAAISARAADKLRLAGELRRVLRPAGRVGFSDLVFSRLPTSAEDRALRALPGSGWDRCVTSRRRRCRPGSTSRPRTTSAPAPGQ